MKKILKTLLLIALVSVLALTLTACGEKKENNTNSTANKNNTVQNTENDANDVNDFEEPENNERGELPDDTEDAKDFTRGKWEENKYVNDFADIKFNLPTGWEKATDEEIAKLMNIGVEALNEDQQKLIEQSGSNSVYGMVANDPASGASIMIIFEDTVLKVTPEYYLSSVKKQLEDVESYYYTVGDITEKELAGAKYSSMDAEISNTIVKQSYYAKTINNYVVSIIITTTQEGQLDTILNCFE